MAEDNKATYKISGYVSVEIPNASINNLLVNSPVKVEIDGTNLTAIADGRGFF